MLQHILRLWGERRVEASLDILETHLDDRKPWHTTYGTAQSPGRKAAIRHRLIQSGRASTRTMRRRTGVPPPSPVQNGSHDARLTTPTHHSLAHIHTNRGVVQGQLYTDEALNTSKHFAQLVKKGRYDNAIFHSSKIGQWIRVGDQV